MSKIINTVPIPKRKDHQSKYDKLPLEKMLVGESILLCNLKNLDGYNALKKRTITINAINRNILKRRLKSQFKAALYKSNTKREIRLWRIN